MIPKKIHYCWFGKNEMPKMAIKCIKSWRKHCPDYEIIEWNEDNFDIGVNQYAYEAYQSKKYAFVSDYVRLHALYNHGGIYMDTDVEVLRSLDEFLTHEAFSGFELPDYVATCILASKKEFGLFKELLNLYSSRKFIRDDGSLDTTTNVSMMTSFLENYGLHRTGEYQVVKGLAIYPREYFCPFDDPTGRLYKTNNTAAIHWFNKSWIAPRKKLKSRITRVFHRYFGINCFKWLKDLYK